MLTLGKHNNKSNGLMNLIVGLGNPGREYANTWHNLGFLAIDKFKEINNFPEFKLSKKFNSLVSEGLVAGEKTILLKPQTLMNNSGKAVKAAIAFYKIKRGDVLIVHDDIDIRLGKIKTVENRGTAGHRGVESIVNELGTKNFKRIRIGIQPEKGKPKDVENFVLQKFSKKEGKVIEEVIRKSAEEIKTAIGKGTGRGI